MVAAKTAIEVPFHSKLVDENGNITYPWQQFFGVLAQATGKLRDGAEGMDDLSAATTVAEVRTAWEELRATLQEIT